MKTTKTGIIYDITYSGTHARGRDFGERFSGKGHMELPDGREYIYAEMPGEDYMAWQLIAPLSLTIEYEPLIDDSMNDKFPQPITLSSTKTHIHGKA